MGHGGLIMAEGEVVVAVGMGHGEVTVGQGEDILIHGEAVLAQLGRITKTKEESKRSEDDKAKERTANTTRGEGKGIRFFDGHGDRVWKTLGEGSQ
jgi:hypothetical protein